MNYQFPFCFDWMFVSAGVWNRSTATVKWTGVNRVFNMVHEILISKAEILYGLLGSMFTDDSHKKLSLAAYWVPAMNLVNFIVPTRLQTSRSLIA